LACSPFERIFRAILPSSIAIATRHAQGMDTDAAYRFAFALLAARQVDREVAAMICQQCEDGQISLEQAIGPLQLVRAIYGRLRKNIIIFDDVGEDVDGI
jgi:hypothetical protein